jgi:hypothetical protein
MLLPSDFVQQRQQVLAPAASADRADLDAVIRAENPAIRGCSGYGSGQKAAAIGLCGVGGLGQAHSLSRLAQMAQPLAIAGLAAA